MRDRPWWSNVQHVMCVMSPAVHGLRVRWTRLRGGPAPGPGASAWVRRPWEFREGNCSKREPWIAVGWLLRDRHVCAFGRARVLWVSSACAFGRARALWVSSACAFRRARAVGQQRMCLPARACRGSAARVPSGARARW